jgi:3-phenylpropionate/trans-cinnamate dioxygenase ferredoxin reductase subunit
MTDSRTFVVVGAGQAGGWAAKTLRDGGFAGRIVLVGEEEYPPYERPPLSKEVLLGTKPPEGAYLWPAKSWDDWKIDLKLGRRATRLDCANRRVELADGEVVGYDRLMLATGARVRMLALPGGELAGVHYLRAIPDTLAIKAAIAALAGPAREAGPSAPPAREAGPSAPKAGRRVLVVGGGWIGLEVAAAARQLGAEVTVVEALDQLCARALTRDLAGHIEGVHRRRGVDVRLKTTVARLEGAGRVERAVLSDGITLACGLVVIGIGIVPDVELAKDAGLAVDNGIVVDDRGRTSDAHVFAAGDATNHPTALLGRRVRLESWENAQNQAIAAAQAMLAADPAAAAQYAEIPWFWSDQYDMNIQLMGLPQAFDNAVTRGDPASGAFTVFYLADGRMVGCAGVNTGRDVRFARRLIQSGRTFDPAALADPSVKLQALTK